MNKEAILKHTTNYAEELIEDLKDPEEAQAYLEAAFGAYEKDGDTGILLLAMRDVAEAQGGIGELASKHKPRLDNWLSILSGLGFRVRLERQDVTAEHAPSGHRV